MARHTHCNEIDGFSCLLGMANNFADTILITHNIDYKTDLKLLQHKHQKYTREWSAADCCVMCCENEEVCEKVAKNGKILLIAAEEGESYFPRFI